MGAEYHIIVNNKYNKAENFIILQHPPTAETYTQKPPIFTTVWAVSPSVAGDHGNVDFRIDNKLWAVSGTSRKPLGDKVVAETTDAEKVDLHESIVLGTKVFMSVREGGAGFDPSKTGSSEVPGGFSIQVDDYDEPDNPLVFVGTGRQNPFSVDEDIIPTAVWSPDPKQTYDVVPKDIFYITNGDLLHGQIVDLQKIGRIAKIDFTAGAGKGRDIAVVNFTQKFEFEPPIYETFEEYKSHHQSNERTTEASAHGGD